MQQSSATPSLHLCFWGLRKIVACSQPYLAVLSCIYSFWHGVIPTSYFIFNDFYTCRVIHQSPDASNHRTPSKCRTTLPVIPTSIHLRLSSAESAFTAARNGHQLHQGLVCRARQAGHLRVSSSRCFFPGSTKCKSIATVRACILVPNPGE